MKSAWSMSKIFSLAHSFLDEKHHLEFEDESTYSQLIGVTLNNGRIYVSTSKEKWNQFIRYDRCDRHFTKWNLFFSVHIGFDIKRIDFSSIQSNEIFSLSTFEKSKWSLNSSSHRLSVENDFDQCRNQCLWTISNAFIDWKSPLNKHRISNWSLIWNDELQKNFRTKIWKHLSRWSRWSVENVCQTTSNEIRRTNKSHRWWRRRSSICSSFHEIKEKIDRYLTENDEFLLQKRVRGEFS